MKKNKKILPLIASTTLLFGPVLLVVSCNYEVSRYSATLSNDLQKREPFSFDGVSQKIDLNWIFKQSFSPENIEKVIKPEIEGIMGKEALISFFTQKLGFTKEKAVETINEVSNSLGNKELMNAYLTAINNGENFDNKVKSLIFQTNNWHQMGTTEFNYSNVEGYQGDNDPNQIFNFNFLNEKLDDLNIDKKIIEVATYADKHDVLTALTKENKKWGSPSTQDQLPPPFSGEKNYQKKIERFQWWLRFRYQQYYNTEILPKINRTLFTIANIINSILTITNTNGRPKIEITNSIFANQLQDWGTNVTWYSKYYLAWNYTTNEDNAIQINNKWEDNKLPELVDSNQKLNKPFFDLLARSNENLKNTLDPIFGANSFICNTEGKVYSTAIKSNKKTISDWLENSDTTNYWGQKNKGTFIYLAPIYWIDVVQNLNFNYKNDENPIFINTDQDPSGLITAWNNNENNKTSSSNFSKFILGEKNLDIKSEEYKFQQERKWNLFWQMLYFLASQDEQNPNKSVAQENYNNAAKIFYPKYIPQEKIYSDEFWEAVKSHY